MDHLSFVFSLLLIVSVTTTIFGSVIKAKNPNGEELESLLKPSHDAEAKLQGQKSFRDQDKEDHKSDGWRKTNLSPICFGAKNHEFGSFFIDSGIGDRKLAALKLVRLYGYVTCATQHNSYWSYWGCRGVASYSAENIDVVITTAGNDVLLPPSEFIVNEKALYSSLPGYTSVSPELVLSFFDPHPVQPGQELRLWYGEDLMSSNQEDNGGRACVDIYAFYV